MIRRRDAVTSFLRYPARRRVSRLRAVSGRGRAAARLRRAAASSTSPAARSMRSAPISASRRRLSAAHGAPPWSFLPALIVSGVLLGAIGPLIERLLRTVYRPRRSFQLLLTFALVLMFQDVLRFFWGANPRELGNLSMSYGKLSDRRRLVPDLQRARDGGERAHRGRARPVPAAHALRPHPARHRREPRDGRGARRQRALDLRQRLHPRHRARHGRRRAGRADGGRLARHAGRARRRGLRGRRHRRPGQHARRAGRRARRRPDPRGSRSRSMPSSRCWRSISSSSRC